MFAHRTATGLTVAFLALPATATAQVQPNPDNRPAAPEPVPAVTALPNPDNRVLAAPTPGLQDLRSPDAVDAARSSQIAQQLRHYRPQPAATVQAPAAANGPDWAPIAFGGVVVLVAAGGFAGARVRSRRVAA